MMHDTSSCVGPGTGNELTLSLGVQSPCGSSLSQQSSQASGTQTAQHINMLTAEGGVFPQSFTLQTFIC